MYERLATYLDLLLKWNARTNLTAIRDPEQIVQRHFGESLFAGLLLGQMLHVEHSTTLLDYGSGAGFPGLPIHLLYPTLHVTLAESQGKKAAFLREAVRQLGTNTEVWSQRVEAMPPSRRFDLVTLRAVDDMAAALSGASERATRGLIILTTSSAELAPVSSTSQLESVPLPGTTDGVLILAQR